MKIWILSDLHTEFTPFIWPAKYADVIILAGDIFTGDGTDFLEEAAEHAEHVLFVPGNHEFYGYEYHERLEFLKSLPCYTLHNRVVEINGVKFAGTTLWTDFNDDDWFAKEHAKRNMNDFYVTKWHNRKFHPDDTVCLNKQARKFLYSNSADVVITHHVPDSVLVAEKWRNDVLNPAFANKHIDFQKVNPQMWIYGHTHDANYEWINNILFVCNPKGYNHENNKFLPDLMVEI